MAKAIRIEDLPAKAQAEAYRKMATELDRGQTPVTKVEPSTPKKWYTKTFRYIVHSIAYLLLTLGRLFMWIGKHLETGGEELLKWIRQQ